MTGVKTAVQGVAIHIGFGYKAFIHGPNFERKILITSRISEFVSEMSVVYGSGVEGITKPGIGTVNYPSPNPYSFHRLSTFFQSSSWGMTMAG